MRNCWLYLFSLLLIGSLGLCVGHISRSGEVSILKEWVSYIPSVIEKPVLVLQFVPLPFMNVARRSSLACLNQQENVLVAQNQTQQGAQPQEVQAAVGVDTNLSTNHMKQIAHVHVPQNNNLSDVSKPLSDERVNALDGSQDQLDDQRELSAEYKKHLEHVCTLLRSINHAQKPVRMLARLELAQVRVAGPLGKYMQGLVTSLLVRYCNEDGKLLHCEHDQLVEDDITKAIVLLQAELQDEKGWGQIARVEFAPIQRRVQRHAYNGALKAVLTSNYIPYTVG